MTGIYCITNTKNQKKYVGQSIDVENRFKEHLKRLRRGVHHNKHLQYSYNKYGEKYFSFEVLEYCSKEELNEKEIFWIDKLDSYNNGYNATIGGGGVTGWIADEEYRKKMSKIVSGKNNPNYNNHWSDEQKQRMSEKLKSSGVHKGANNARATKIICVETLEVFDYIELAAEKLNIKNSSAITRTLNNKSYVANGYHFVKYDENTYNYLKDNQYEYLCECLRNSGDAKYYANNKERKIYKKSELFDLIHSQSNIKTRDIQEMLKEKTIEFNNNTYIMLN